jgi:hypothetical protein
MEWIMGKIDYLEWCVAWISGSDNSSGSFQGGKIVIFLSVGRH